MQFLILSQVWAFNTVRLLDSGVNVPWLRRRHRLYFCCKSIYTATKWYVIFYTIFDFLCEIIDLIAS